MKRLIASIMLGLVVLVAVGGCDLTSVTDTAKAIVTARSDSGDVLMTQLQIQDQLKDGTGANCPTARQIETGAGLGDVLRLRDGSCQD